MTQLFGNLKHNNTNQVFAPLPTCDDSQDLVGGECVGRDITHTVSLTTYEEGCVNDTSCHIICTKGNCATESTRMAGWALIPNTAETQVKLTTLYTGSDCTCPTGIAIKSDSFSGSALFGESTTNAALSALVEVGTSFLDLTIKIPIGSESGQIVCTVTATETTTARQRSLNLKTTDLGSERRGHDVFRSPASAAPPSRFGGTAACRPTQDDLFGRTPIRGSMTQATSHGRLTATSERAA
eukprot:CAMPEP_0173404478 /NCGR_PEP_ID=MMETSP1356-20130122/59442_1 /TAXON_ID=77927 ORGANISM="Hemiselmis virescens, Strain PCC157" /NCGR_SAMPLE_ID=MMETSP1356 /ASSEMBLY_ACC=CAM_ASM_000847 /LENGTH=239 /DNA_ID=CAMNT_0014365163 /DNA_START=352 /DNA_END=1069 /DNA_ORIENTATION=-